MSIKRLQNTLIAVFDGPFGGFVLAAFLIGALLVYIYSGNKDIPFVYQQF